MRQSHPTPLSCRHQAKGSEPTEHCTSSKKCPSVKVSWTRNEEDCCQVRCSTRHCSTRNVSVTMSPSREKQQFSTKGWRRRSCLPWGVTAAQDSGQGAAQPRNGLGFHPFHLQERLVTRATAFSCWSPHWSSKWVAARGSRPGDVCPRGKEEMQETSPLPPPATPLYCPFILGTTPISGDSDGLGPGIGLA